jgi:hypothetical protein
LIFRSFFLCCAIVLAFAGPRQFDAGYTKRLSEASAIEIEAMLLNAATGP